MAKSIGFVIGPPSKPSFFSLDPPGMAEVYSDNNIGKTPTNDPWQSQCEMLSTLHRDQIREKLQCGQDIQVSCCVYVKLKAHYWATVVPWWKTQFGDHTTQLSESFMTINLTCWRQQQPLKFGAVVLLNSIKGTALEA
jgi:hypothetical protein